MGHPVMVDFIVIVRIGRIIDVVHVVLDETVWIRILLDIIWGAGSRRIVRRNIENVLEKVDVSSIELMERVLLEEVVQDFREEDIVQRTILIVIMDVWRSIIVVSMDRIDTITGMPCIVVALKEVFFDIIGTSAQKEVDGMSIMASVVALQDAIYYQDDVYVVLT